MDITKYPLVKSDRNLTCMTTPRWVMRSKVIVMGLQNGNAIFQRVMEEVLKGLDFADPYVDDIIIGSTGSTEMECLINHNNDLRTTLNRLQASGLYANNKAQLFVKEVTFCGHILKDGKDSLLLGNSYPSKNGKCPRASPI